MSAEYTLGFVQRDGNMHDYRAYGDDLRLALTGLEEQRTRSNPLSTHWFVYDADDPERGYFDPGDEAA